MNYLSYDAIVIGTGAAGYNAACRIAQDGRKSVCLVTEDVNFGTSRNTGSDKQTYYKLGLGGSSPDSVRHYYRRRSAKWQIRGTAEPHARSIKGESVCIPL
jgi:succinate dehydrogenase/fumarate reductase flavoprotein subunit